MKRLIVAVPLALALALPLAVRAHETQIFEVQGKQYRMIVGSINEPLVVDDKSGVELRVASLPGNTPVEGLQDTLKVELIAGDKKKELAFDTVYNTPGAYKAPFFPTVATTLSYRVFGEIAGAPFNVTFTCLAGGHSEAAEDKTRVEISEGVTRISKTGGYGCPEPKTDLGFPEASSDLRSLVPQKPGTGTATAALALSVIALVLAMVRRRS